MARGGKYSRAVRQPSLILLAATHLGLAPAVGVGCVPQRLSAGRQTQCSQKRWVWSAREVPVDVIITSYHYIITITSYHYIIPLHHTHVSCTRLRVKLNCKCNNQILCMSITAQGCSGEGYESSRLRCQRHHCTCRNSTHIN